jgi:hypothetical protein
VSRDNIIFSGFVTKDRYVVVFNARSGPRAYEFDAVDGLAIAAGGDPAHYSGEEVSAATVLANVGENAEDLAELLL